MEELADWVKMQYEKRRAHFEKQWPPCRGKKLVELQLVERDAYVHEQEEKQKGAREADYQDDYNKKSIKHTPIECSELFESKPGENVIQTVLLEGHAGIGKTSFCTILTEEWGNDKLFQHFKLVLFLPLRDEEVTAAKSVTDLLKIYSDDEELCDEVSAEFKKRGGVYYGGKNVLIVADGWDELSESHRSKKSFLYKLLVKCSILPRACVLLTSRPSASAPLHNLKCFHRFVQVVGFDRGNIKKYFESELTPEKASQLVEQLDRNPMIESICSIPLNCAIVCHLFRELGEVLPRTMTELYTKIILVIIARNVSKKLKTVTSFSSFSALPEQLHANWWLLCEFAFLGIKNNKIVFSRDEIEKFFPRGATSVDEIQSSFGLLQSFEALLSGGTGKGLSFNFLHLTVQEYLAAFHLVRLSIDKQLQICKSYGHYGHFRMVWRFFFGIKCNISEICGSVQSKLTIPSPTIYEITQVISCFVTASKLLCHCSFESNSRDIKALIAQALTRKRFQCTAGTAHDCAVFIDAFHNFSPGSEVNLSIAFIGCNLGDRGVIPLADVLAKSSAHLQVSDMFLDLNNLTDDDIKTLFMYGNHTNSSAAFQALQMLYLSNNKIGKVGVESIITTLSIGSHCNLSTLDLSNNPLGISGIQALEDGIDSGTLNNLKELSLAGTLTNDPYINGALLTTLLASIAIHCTKLCKLNLSNNYLGIPGAQAVGAACSKLCQFTSSDQFFSSMSNGTFNLHLGRTKLGDEGAIAFTQNLNSPCFFGELNIADNALHCDAVIAISQSVSSGVLTMRVLTLDYNPLGLDGAIAIHSMITCQSFNDVVTVLSVRNCNLSSGKLLPEKCPKQLIGCHKSFVHFIHLDGSSLTGQSIEILALFMSQCSELVNLSCSNCSITSDDLTVLFLYFQKIPVL